MPISLIQHSELLTKKVIGKFDEKRTVKTGFGGFFPEETTPSLEVDIEVQRDSDFIAVDVMRFTEGNVGQSARMTEKKFIPPYYKQEYYFNLDSVYMSTIAMGIMDNPNVNKQLGVNAVKNMEKERLKIERAIRKQQAQVLQTGIVTLKNGDNIDFKRKAGSMVNVSVGGVYWSDLANAKPIDDISKGLKFLRGEGASNAMFANVIMRDTAYNNFMNTAQIKGMADIRNINRVTLDMPQLNDASGMAFHGQLGCGDFTVNIWTYNESYTNPETNLREYYLDENKVVILPNDFEGKTVFGGIPSMKEMNVGGTSVMVPSVEESKYLMRSFADERTTQSGLELTSAPLVIPFTIDKIYTMQVTA